MDVALTTTWNPHGELERLKRLLPALSQLYASITVVLPPSSMVRQSDPSANEDVRSMPDLRAFEVEDWSLGRHAALGYALGTSSSHIQYTDMDRLLRWVETRPEELEQVTKRMAQADCLVVGRTAQAYGTHPQALVQTERISNMVVSHFLGRSIDVSAGCKGFSRRAAEYIVSNAIPISAFSADAEWTILLHRAGFALDYIEVDGLDWESADRHQASAVSDDVQRRLALEYDADSQHWAFRTEVARDIVQVALEVQCRKFILKPEGLEWPLSDASEKNRNG